MSNHSDLLPDCCQGISRSADLRLMQGTFKGLPKPKSSAVFGLDRILESPDIIELSGLIRLDVPAGLQRHGDLYL